MLFLVTIPTLPKRIQQNADSSSEAISAVFDNLSPKLRQGISVSDCSAEALDDPMDQFKKPYDVELD